MKVLTLNDQSFAMHCKVLEARVLSDGYEPDLVVGIGLGGNYVAEKMFDKTPHVNIIPGHREPDEVSTTLSKTLKNKPKIFKNAIRLLQSLFMTLRNHGLYQVDVPAGLDQYQKILVVADTVDSGSTLASVMTALGNRCRAAALTVVSVRTPIITPRYYIYKNHTLLRFPWSADA